MKSEQRNSVHFSNSTRFPRNILRLLTATSILMATQAFAVITIKPNTLTATPSPTNPREIHFHLPLNGNTSKCIITITYGETSGVYPNNDGDTHINGNTSLERMRVYNDDASFTFTAKAKSGCEGEASIRFTIPKPTQLVPARTGAIAPPPVPKLAILPASAVVVGNKSMVPVENAPVNVSKSDLKIAHTRITKLETSATDLEVGQLLTVKVFGSGSEAKCPTALFVVTPGGKQLYGPAQSGTGAWPRTHTFTVNLPGVYTAGVHQVNQSDYSEIEACGDQPGLNGIPGNYTKVNVTMPYMAK